MQGLHACFLHKSVDLLNDPPGPYWAKSVPAAINLSDAEVEESGMLLISLRAEGPNKPGMDH